MQFLKTLFWVILAVVLVLFARANWESVTLNLWGGLQADVKLPALVIFAFLAGFLPTFIIYRARVWSLRRRLEGQVQTHVANHPQPVRPSPVHPVPPSRPADGGAAPSA